MANTDLEKLVVQLSADIKGYQREMNKALGVTNKQARAIENRYRQMNKNLDSIGKNAARSLMAPLAGVGAALGARELIRLTDTWTDLTSRVNIAAGSQERGAEVMDRLGQIARRTYSGIEQTTESYVRNATAMRELGYTTDQTLDFTEALNNALVVSGAKGERAESVMNAISKAMALGSLQGDNLNTVIESGGRVAEALAKSMGVATNDLRRLGTQGKITTRELFGITKELNTLRVEADSMPATIGDGVLLLRDALLKYVGGADSAIQASANISQALILLADNFDQTADVALKLAGVIGGALLGRSLLSMVPKLGLAAGALASFMAAARAATTLGGVATAIGGLGAAAGPAGLIIGGALTAAVIAFSGESAEAKEASELYATALDNVKDSADSAAAAIEKVEKARKREGAYKAAIDLGVDEQERLNGAIEARINLLDSSSMRGYVTPEQLAQLREAGEKFEEGEITAGEFRAEIERLGVTKIDLSKFLDPTIAKLEAARRATAALREEMATLPTVETETDTSAEKARAAAEAYIKDAQRRNTLSKEQHAIETEIAKIRADSLKNGVQLTEEQTRALAAETVAAQKRRQAEGKSVKATADDRVDRDLQQAWDRVAALKEEQAVIGLTVGAQESRRMALDLEQSALAKLREEARKKGITDLESIKLTPEQVAAIRQVSEAYGEQAQKLEDLTDRQELFDGAASAIASFAGSAITDFDNVGDALENLKKQLIDLVLQFAVLGPLKKSLSGLFGGLFGAAGAPLDLSSFTQLSSGGYTGDGGKYQPKGIVHGGEYVFSKEAVQRAGKGNLEAMHRRLKGYASGGYVGGSAGGARSDGGTTVQVIDQRQSGTVEQRRERGPNGREIIRMMIRDEINTTIATGKADGSMRARFGERPRTY